MTGLYHILGYKKKVPYIINEVFTNGTVRFQQGKLHEIINIKQLKPQFNE